MNRASWTDGHMDMYEDIQEITDKHGTNLYVFERIYWKVNKNADGILFCWKWYVIKNMCMHAKLLQSCPTLYNTMDCSPLCSSVHGILQARILEWGSMPSSRGSSWPRDPNGVSCVSWQTGSLPLVPLGKPQLRTWSLLKYFSICIYFI